MEHINEMINILKAYKDGATIQLLDDYGKWVDVAEPGFDFGSFSYRVKPTSTSFSLDSSELVPLKITIEVSA